MSTEIKFSKEARESLKKGVDLVANAVKVSMGAEGLNVIIPSPQGFAITKDGVSIARSIFPDDKFAAIGAALIKEAASRTNFEAGDGTTASTVLAQALFNGGLKLIEQGESPVELKKGIDEATIDVVQYLKKASKKVTKDNLINVATISANGDEELGKIISEAFNKIGENGQVITDVSDTSETTIQLREGTVLDKGYMSRAYRTDTLKDICELENPFVLLHRGKIEKGDKIVKLFDTVFKKPDGKLLIITDDIDPFVSSFIMQNVESGVLKGKICIVEIPQVLKINVDLLSDLSVLTGAKIVNEVLGTRLEIASLGKIKKCIVSEKDTLIIGDANNLNEVVKEVKEKIEITENKFDRKDLQERLARITGGIAILKVGAKSDSALKEKQDRIEDSINATRSALQEGIVAGGGVFLLDAVSVLKENNESSLIDIDNHYSSNNEPIEGTFNKGYNLLLDACLEPSNQINKNANLSYTHGKKGVGLNVKTGEAVDMMEEGIIDPSKVVRCALENASSVASTFLTTEAVVALKK